MKKTTLIVGLLAIALLSSCNKGFYNTKHHAHRDYVRIGPGVKTDVETSSLTNTVMEPAASAYKPATSEKDIKVPTNTERRINKNTPLNNEAKMDQKSPGKKSSFVSKVKKLHQTPVVKKQQKKPVVKKQKVEGAKKTNGVGYFNIISFCMGMLEIIALGLYIAFYFALNVFGVLAMLIMMIVCGVLGIGTGIAGLAMGQEQKKLGIVGIILCGLFLIIAIVDLVI